MSETNNDLLQIYDSGAKTKLWHNVLFEPRDEAAVSVGVTKVAELHVKLRELLAAGKTFSRLLVETHGESGILWIGRDPLAYFEFFGNEDWREAGYDKLFPGETKVVFGGCNVADGDDGWKFLENCGKLLLKKGGGTTLGWTSLGFHLLNHDMHLWGEWRRVRIKGGKVESRIGSDENVVPDIKRPWDNRWR